MKKIALITIMAISGLVPLHSEAKQKKVAVRKDCGEWKNYYNADGNVAYRMRQCNGYSQMQTFR